MAVPSGKQAQDGCRHRCLTDSDLNNNDNENDDDDNTNIQ